MLLQGVQYRPEIEALVGLLPTMLYDIHVAAVSPGVRDAVNYFVAFTQFIRSQCGGSSSSSSSSTPTVASPPVLVPLLTALCAGPAPEAPSTGAGASAGASSSGDVTASPAVLEVPVGGDDGDDAGTWDFSVDSSGEQAGGAAWEVSVEGGGGDGASSGGGSAVAGDAIDRAMAALPLAALLDDLTELKGFLTQVGWGGEALPCVARTCPSQHECSRACPSPFLCTFV